jgi:hypothetical protein
MDVQISRYSCRRSWNISYSQKTYESVCARQKTSIEKIQSAAGKTLQKLKAVSELSDVSFDREVDILCDKDADPDQENECLDCVGLVFCRLDKI